MISIGFDGEMDISLARPASMRKDDDAYHHGAVRPAGRRSTGAKNSRNSSSTAAVKVLYLFGPADTEVRTNGMIEAFRGCDVARLNLLFEARRLERLARDMRVIAAGLSPTAADLEAAPIIDGWQYGRRTLTSLVGTSIGHPRLPDGPVHTTDLWIIDSERRWARTLSRYYVLGAPHVGGDHDQ